MAERQVRYARNGLALLRKAAGLTQMLAAPLLSIKHHKHLCHMEIGQVIVPAHVMKRMVVVYQATPVEVLRASVESFESGRLMIRHAARKARLLSLQAAPRTAKVAVAKTATGGDTAEEPKADGTTP